MFRGAFESKTLNFKLVYLCSLENTNQLILSINVNENQKKVKRI